MCDDDCQATPHYLDSWRFRRDARFSRYSRARADAHRVFRGGQTIDEFLDGFPTVTREQVIAFLEEATIRMLPVASWKFFSTSVSTRRLAQEIDGHEVVTVPQTGWAGIQNGELLRRVQEQSDVFVTVDRNLSFQQHLPQFNIAVIVLQAPSNRLKDLRPLMPQFNRTVLVASKGQVTLVTL